jgi:tRNA dimethylallyltransferase
VWATPSHKLTSDRVKVAALVGPTAAGKTETSISVAQALDAEIVSIDSMQIYRGMDIGTAKPTARERAGIPHHLIDIRDASEDVSVAEFQELARSAIGEISARGRLPMLVGGSGLYFRSVVDQLDFPPQAPEVRTLLEAELETLGTEALYERLRRFDPLAADRIEPANSRRIVRALEVIEVTGKPFSENVSWDTYESIYELTVAGLARERPDLYERIERRVDHMLENGLIEEVRRLGAAGLSHTAAQAVGYRQVLESDDASGAREAIVRATKRFARRQESWFRADPRITWFDASAPGLPTALAEHFRHLLRLP